MSSFNGGGVTKVLLSLLGRFEDLWFGYVFWGWLVFRVLRI